MPQSQMQIRVLGCTSAEEMTEILRRCTKCGEQKPLSAFYNQSKGKYGKMSYCKTCDKERGKLYAHVHPGRTTRLYHVRGIHKPMSEAKDSPLWLGVHISERVLMGYFENVIRMPHGNPGYDFMCERGYKIDAKSSCLHLSRGCNTSRWTFGVNRNQIADYFLCLAFDNREDLNPLHIWLIPGEEVNMLSGFSVYNSLVGLEKWWEYERPICNVVGCCHALKEAKHCNK